MKSIESPPLKISDSPALDAAEVSQEARAHQPARRGFRVEAALALVIFVFLAATATWIRRDTVPPLWDSAVYLQQGAIQYHALQREGLLAFLDAFSHTMDKKAPLIAALPIPLYFVLGETHSAARFVNLGWIVLASIFLFRIGRRVAGDAAGLLAVVVLNTFPLVAGMSRQYLVEYGLMAMVIVWVDYLLCWRTREAKSAPWLLGALLGFGLLLKVTFPLYVATPTLLVMGQRYARERRIRPLLLDLVRIAVVALPIAALWYARNLGGVLNFLVSAGFGEAGRPYGTGPVFSIQAIRAYWQGLINVGVSVYYFALLSLVFAGWTVAAWRRRATRPALASRSDLHLLWGWWLVPWLALTFAANKDPRYAMPYFPALALLLAAGVAAIASRPRRVAVFSVIAALGLLNYFYYSFAARWIPVDHRLGGFVLVSGELVWARPPTSETWPDEEVLRIVAEDAKPGGEARVRVRVLFSHPSLNAHILNYLATLRDLAPRFATVHFQTPEALPELITQINSEFAYLLTKSGFPGPAMLNTRNLEVVSALNRGDLHFAPIAEVALPDGSAVTVHRRIEAASPPAPAGPP